MKRLLLSIAFFLGMCLLFYVTWIHATLGPPVFEAIPLQNVAENSALVIHIYSTVTTGDSIIVKCPGLPSGAVLFDSGTAVTPHWGAGTITWTPSYSQAGTYVFNVFDSSYAFAGGGKDTVGVSIVVSNVNRKPAPVAVGTNAVLEGAALSIHVWATDADADAMTWAVKTGQLPSGAVFTDSGTGGGLFTWTPSYTQAGQYTPYFRITDALSDKDSTQGTINVWNVSRPPVLYAVLAAKKTVAENATLVDTIHSSDPDADAPLTITHSTLPSRLTHTDSIFTYAPNYTDSGHYSVDFYVADTTGVGALKDTISVIYTVTNVNQAPVLASIGAKSVNEGATLTIHTWAPDADGDSVSYLVTGLPTGAVFHDSADAGGLFTWTPTYSQSGAFNVVFKTFDFNYGAVVDSDYETVTITVGNIGATLDTIENAIVIHGDSSVVHVFTTSTDTISLRLLEIVDNATVVDSGTGGGIFKFVPTWNQNGIWRFDIEARTKGGGDLDTESFWITVEDTTQTISSHIYQINNNLSMIVVEKGTNGGRTISGVSGADTSSWYNIGKYTTFTTAYRMTQLGTGDTSTARIYAQVATDITYPFKADSVTIAKNDTSSTSAKIKTWSIPAVPYLRFITRGLDQNDTCIVYMRHTFR